MASALQKTDLGFSRWMASISGWMAIPLPGWTWNRARGRGGTAPVVHLLRVHGRKL